MGRTVVLTSLFAIAVSVALVPAKVGAQTQSTTCNLTAQGTFDPGLTFTEQNQTVTLRGRLTSCVGGGVTDAVFKGRGEGQMSCTGGSGSGRAGIRWNTGETSIADITVSTTGEFTGTITSGKFVGEPITGDVTVQPGPGDCIFRPIETATLTGTLAL